MLPGTLRAKLAATAAAGFVLTGLMTVLVLQTTRDARRVVQQAEASHERMRAFARIQSTANRLQQLTYQNVRTGDARSATELRAARADFIAALAALRTSPQSDIHERRLVDTVESEGEAVLGLFSHGEDIVKAVDDSWHSGGSRAALEEVQTLSEPYRVFANTVSREVEREDQKVSTDTARALAGQRAVQRAALVGLALAFALSVVVFVVLQALQEHRAGLERAVAARTAELERANAALSAEDERRRTFLADASHELRMPLTIIRGEAQVALRAGDEGTPDTTEALERIFEQTRVLTRLLDDLFLIARAEAGGLRLNLRTVDLGEVVLRVAHDFSTIACESGATVRADAQCGLFARVDPDRVRQALAALIDNALRHTRPGVDVRVAAQADDDWISITVTDDGPGIDPAAAADLFGRFRRGRTRSDGSGLGLTVVRALAEAHGGTASLVNAEQGGARAILNVPRAAEPTLAIPVAAAALQSA